MCCVIFVLMHVNDNVEAPMSLTPLIVSLDCGKMSDRTNTDTGRTCELHTERPQTRWWIRAQDLLAICAWISKKCKNGSIQVIQSHTEHEKHYFCSAPYHSERDLSQTPKQRLKELIAGL